MRLDFALVTLVYAFHWAVFGLDFGRDVLAVQIHRLLHLIVNRLTGRAVVLVPITWTLRVLRLFLSWPFCLAYVIITNANCIHAVVTNIQLEVTDYVEPKWSWWDYVAWEYLYWPSCLVYGALIYALADIGARIPYWLLDMLAPGEYLITAIKERLLSKQFERQPLARENVNPSNDHSDAAAARGGAHRFMTYFAQQTGHNLYDWFGSNRSKAHGIPVYRPLVSMKDAASYDQPVEDPIPGNPMFMLVNVAHWLTESQLSDVFRRGPTLLYETTPTAPGFTDCGIQHRYGNGKWTAEVPNNRYVHRLYNWEGERRLIDETPRVVTLLARLLKILAACTAAIYVLYFGDYRSTLFTDIAGNPVVKCITQTVLHLPTNLEFNGLSALAGSSSIFSYSGWKVIRVVWWTTYHAPGWLDTCAPYFMRALEALFAAWTAATIMATGASALQLLAGWGTVLVRIRRRKVTDHSTVLLVYPVRRWNAFASALRSPTVEPENRLRYLEPLTLTGKKGTFHYMRVVNGTRPDELRVSLDQTSCYVGVTTEQELALRTQLTTFAAGRQPAGTTAHGALRRAAEQAAAQEQQIDGVRHAFNLTPEQATTLVHAIITLVDHQPPVVPALNDPRGLPYMTGSYGSACAEDDEATNKMWSFMRPIIGTGFHADDMGKPTIVPALNSASARASREARKEQSRNHVVTSEADLNLLRQFNDRVFRSAITAGVSIGSMRLADYEDVLEVQNSAHQKAAYQQVFAGYDLKGQCVAGEQTKPKEVTKKPRSIMPVTTAEHRMGGSRVARQLAEVLKCQHWYGNVTPERLGEIIQQKANNCTNECEADATNRDGTHGWLSRALMVDLITKTFTPEDVTEAITAFDAIHDAIVIGRAGTYYNGNGLKSGVPWTTIQNSAGGAFIEFKHRVLSGMPHDAAFAALGLHAGDDCIMFSLPQPHRFSQRAWENGAIMKFIALPAHSCRVTFLSRVWNTQDGSSGPCVARCLSKVHMTGMPTSTPRADVAAMKGFSLGYLDCGIPLFRNLAFALCRDSPAYLYNYKQVCAAFDVGEELPDVNLAGLTYNAKLATEARCSYKAPCQWYQEYCEEELGGGPLSALLDALEQPEAHYDYLPTILTATVPAESPMDLKLDGEPIPRSEHEPAPTLQLDPDAVAGPAAPGGDDKPSCVNAAHKGFAFHSMTKKRQGRKVLQRPRCVECMKPGPCAKCNRECPAYILGVDRLCTNCRKASQEAKAKPAPKSVPKGQKPTAATQPPQRDTRPKAQGKPDETKKAPKGKGPAAASSALPPNAQAETTPAGAAPPSAPVVATAAAAGTAPLAAWTTPIAYDWPSPGADSFFAAAAAHSATMRGPSASATGGPKGAFTFGAQPAFKASGPRLTARRPPGKPPVVADLFEPPSTTRNRLVDDDDPATPAGTAAQPRRQEAAPTVAATSAKAQSVTSPATAAAPLPTATAATTPQAPTWAQRAAAPPVAAPSANPPKTVGGQPPPGPTPNSAKPVTGTPKGDVGGPSSGRN
jgi:hypothetical protein